MAVGSTLTLLNVDPTICAAVACLRDDHALFQVGKWHRSRRNVNRRKFQPLARRPSGRVRTFPVASGRLARYRRPVQTLDPQTATPSGALASPATARNTAPILQVLRAHLPARGRVLEVAAGAGEHAVAFARALPGLRWTPTDPSAEARASIDAWAARAALPNLEAALVLDAADDATWPTGEVEAVVCINMIHISPWTATEGLMRLAGRRLRPGGLLALYGPYREPEVPLAPSNAAFDASLKARDPAWGLRDRETVVAAATGERLALTRRVEMPANNLMLLFRRV
jgi:SAM-dependent methyltransferase